MSDNYKGYFWITPQLIAHAGTNNLVLGPDEVINILNRETAQQAELTRLREENVKLKDALQGLSDMYGHSWDLVDGGLMMMESSVEKFEIAHEKADRILRPEIYLYEDDEALAKHKKG